MLFYAVTHTFTLPILKRAQKICTSTQWQRAQFINSRLRSKKPKHFYFLPSFEVDFEQKLNDAYFLHGNKYILKHKIAPLKLFRYQIYYFRGLKIFNTSIFKNVPERTRENVLKKYLHSGTQDSKIACICIVRCPNRLLPLKK